MMKVLALFVNFLSSVSLRINGNNFQIPGYTLAPAEKKIAAAFGGGGCFSVLSQLGYLRGLLGDDVGGGNDGLKMTAVGTSSGGGWALGSFFMTSEPGGLLDLYLHGKVSPQAEGIGNFSQNKFWESNLGRWCMFHNLHHGVSPDEWSFKMSACGRCAMSPEGCTNMRNDPIFGIAAACIKDPEKNDPDPPPSISGLLKQFENWSENIKLASPFQRSAAFRTQFLASWMETVYKQFFEPQGLRRDMKLNELQSVFKSDKFGETQWGVFWSKFTGVAPPFAIGSLSPGGSGSALQSSMTVLEAITRSGDAISGTVLTLILQAEISSNCEYLVETIANQTSHDEYPYPWGPLSPATGDIEWGVDGLNMDNNAIGQTIQLMEKVDKEKRPRTLVSLITGNLNNDDQHNVGQVLGYFKKKVSYSLLWFDPPPVKEMPSLKNNCSKLNNLLVNNPTHFFSYNPSVRPDLSSKCTEEVMLSASDVVPDCWNFKHQADATGTIFVREADVVSNKLWGISGGWNVTIMFTILSQNEASRAWIKSVYTKNEDRVRFGNFPVFPNPNNVLMGMHAKDGFALMNYNAYKGYMTSCALLHFQTNGQQECIFCKAHSEYCASWLPFITDARKR